MDDQLVLALDVGGSSVKSALVADGQHLVGRVCVDDLQSGASAPMMYFRHGVCWRGSAVQSMDHNALAKAFGSFGTDLGTFLKPFASNFRAEAVLISGGIAETWDRFGPSLMESLAVPVLKGKLGQAAALLGAAALYF